MQAVVCHTIFLTSEKVEKGQYWKYLNWTIQIIDFKPSGDFSWNEKIAVGVIVHDDHKSKYKAVGKETSEKENTILYSYTKITPTLTMRAKAMYFNFKKKYLGKKDD